MKIKKLLSNKKRTIISAILFWAVLSIIYFSVFDKSILKSNSYSTLFFDRNGKILRTVLSDKERYTTKISLSGISPHFLRAIVLIEDKSFYSHHGVSINAIFRALFQNVKERKIKSGASTITMQLAKLLKNNISRNIFNKISETVYALKLEMHLDKSTILEEYINRLPFGNMIYGIESASKYYFKKKPKDLSLNQAIYLALIPKSPTLYNPIKHIKRLTQRKKIILNEFLKRKYISKNEYLRVSKEGIRFSIDKKSFIAPHLIERLQETNKFKTSKIITTIDRNLQSEITGIIKEALRRLKPYKISSAACVIIDNKTHEVIVYIGSPDYFNKKNSGFVDYADSLRQPGSTLKPFIYALALENGRTPASIIPDIKFPARGGFFPSNYDGKEHGPLRLRPALANSFNIPAFYLAMKLTPQLIIEKLQEAGFLYLDENSGFYGETIALGAGEVKLFDLVKAYSLFANGGIIYKPSFIKGRKNKKRRVFSEKTAYLIWNILSDPNARAMSFGYNSSMKLPFPLAIKTGTSKGFRDKWAIGVNSEFTVGVWLGNPSGKNMRDLTGTANSTSILRDIFLLIQKDWTKGNIKKPKGLVNLKICTISGERATRYCKDTIDEIFDENNLPQEYCSYHKLRKGNIITVYPELYKTWAIKNKLIDRAEIIKNNRKKISFPQKRDFFYISKDIPIESQRISFKIMGFKNGDIIEYILNDKVIAKLPYPDFPSWQLERGDYTLKIQCNNKTIDTTVFLVR